MEQRRLGTSGFTVPLLGLGTNNIGGRSDEAASLKVIDASIEIGANFFDTANIYTGTKSETIIGKALKGRAGQGDPHHQVRHCRRGRGRT